MTLNLTFCYENLHIFSSNLDATGPNSSEPIHCCSQSHKKFCTVTTEDVPMKISDSDA